MVGPIAGLILVFFTVWLVADFIMLMGFQTFSTFLGFAKVVGFTWLIYTEKPNSTLNPKNGRLQNLLSYKSSIIKERFKF